MTYIEFADAVEKMMNKKMKGGVRASLYTAMKNNGKERTGILIEMPGINISPTIYLEEYYESYVAGRKIEQIVDDIKQLYEEIKQEKPWDCESFRDYEGVRNRIVFKVINTAKNRKFLRTVPHLAFLDLSIVFYVLVDVSEEGTAACIAYPNVLEMIGQILKKDYYILPSSVHEVIIVPYSEIYVCSKLDEMVREINSTQVEEEDVLSNHVYLYDRVSGKLRVGSSVQTGRMMA